MKNNQHKYILKAFLESKIPSVIYKNSPELILVDSILGGYCTQLLGREKHIKLTSNKIISKEEKMAFSELINHSTGTEKEELVIYYRLVILVEAILIQYA